MLGPAQGQYVLKVNMCSLKKGLGSQSQMSAASIGQHI